MLALRMQILHTPSLLVRMWFLLPSHLVPRCAFLSQHIASGCPFHFSPVLALLCSCPSNSYFSFMFIADNLSVLFLLVGFIVLLNILLCSIFTAFYKSLEQGIVTLSSSAILPRPKLLPQQVLTSMLGPAAVLLIKSVKYSKF